MTYLAKLEAAQGSLSKLLLAGEITGLELVRINAVLEDKIRKVKLAIAASRHGMQRDVRKRDKFEYFRTIDMRVKRGETK